MMTKKEFAIKAIKPYYDNPDICGYNKKLDCCSYKTPDGKMCVAGKYLLNAGMAKDGERIFDLVNRVTDQKYLFKKEAVDVLSADEWEYLQGVHDAIAVDNVDQLQKQIKKLRLFSINEI